MFGFVEFCADVGVQSHLFEVGHQMDTEVHHHVPYVFEIFIVFLSFFVFSVIPIVFFLGGLILLVPIPTVDERLEYLLLFGNYFA